MIKIRNNSLTHRSIDIDISEGVSIHLYKEQYDTLCNLLCADLKDEFVRSLNRLVKADETRKECYNFTKEIREIFYDCEDDCDYAILRDLKKIDPDKLYAVLEKYSKLLGFE